MGIVSYESIKDKIVVKLVNKEKSSDYLSDKISRDFLDLAIVFSIDLGKNMSVPITKEMSKLWGVNPDRIYEKALENVKNCKYIENVLLYDLIVVTNESGIFGANVLLNCDVMDKLSEKFGGDFYIIPSSIHDVIALSSNYVEEEDMSFIRKMISSVNSVVADEALSNNLYAYDSTQREVVFAEVLKLRNKGCDLTEI